MKRDVEGGEEEDSEDKKGRSIRIRIETFVFYVIPLKLLQIKKEDPLE